MEAFPSLPLVYLIMTGLGAWLPIAGAGIRFMIGGAFIPLGLFVANYVIGLPLGASAWILTVAAAAGIAFRLWRRPRRVDRWALAVHPVIVLPVLAAVIAGRHDEYVPYSWDEFSNWLYWAKEAWLFDTIGRRVMGWHAMGYPQGLPLAIAFPNLFHERFDLARSPVVLFLWHVGLMALIYDVICQSLQRAFAVERVSARLIAWILVLGSLAVEATWTLLPQLILSEKPQIYFLAGTLGLVLLALFDEDARNSIWHLLAIGVLAAVGYLIKVAFIVFVPSLVLFAAAFVWLRASDQGRGEHGQALIPPLLILAPLVVVYVAWNGLLPFAKPAGCAADPIALLETSPIVGGTSASVFSQFLVRLGAYLYAFKPWLTAIAVLGIVASLFDRRAVFVAIGLGLYAAGYAASLLVLYSFCFAGYEAETFASLQRYSRVPIRLIHLFGPLMLLIIVVKLVSSARVPGWRGPWMERPARMTALCVIGALMAYQAVALNKSLANAARRDRETPETVAQIARVRQGAFALRAMIEDLGLDNPRAAIVAQGDDGFAYVQARYWSLADTRHGRATHYRIAPPYSWGPAEANYWMTKTSRQRLRTHLLSLDVIWPYRTDGWIGPVIADLTGDPRCASDTMRYFLVATGRSERPMRCIAKATFLPNQRAVPSKTP